MFSDDFLDQLKQGRHHRERWLTPEGQALKEKLVSVLQSDGWDSLLVGFPYANDVVGARDLRHIDLSGFDLTSAKLAGADLSGANLSGCVLDGADFTGSIMRATNLSGARCQGSEFAKATIYGVDFRRADLSGSRFSELEISAAMFDEAVLTSCTFARSKLQSVGMAKARLEGADLTDCTTSFLDLSDAVASRARFDRSNLTQANLSRANLAEASFTLAKLAHCSLLNANLDGAQLDSVDLIRADLSYAQLCGAVLRGADLTSAQLFKAQLPRAELDGCVARHSNLSESNLAGASLRGVDLRYALLVGADLSGTIVTHCAVYGASTWDVTTTPETIISDLVITADNQPVLTVDDLELAQFIHMIVNNKKIARMVDVMRTKVVLVLGAFDDETKPVLDKMKHVLRRNGFVPVVFDFDKPTSQRLIETVRTLALLSAFVVVDVSRPAGQLVELKIVDDTRVPFATIMVEGTVPTAMLKDLGDYYWYRQDPFAYPAESTDAVLDDMLVGRVVPWTREIRSKLLAS